MWKWDTKPTWRLEDWKEKQQPEGIHPGQLMSLCLLNQVEGLIVPLTLIKGLLFCSYKTKQ